MREPRRDHYVEPATGADTETSLDATIEMLAGLRGLEPAGDAGVCLHLLLSLVAEAQARLPHAVAEARDQDYSWAQIADLLGVTRASAWQRYAGMADRHRSPLDSD